MQLWLLMYPIEPCWGEVLHALLQDKQIYCAKKRQDTVCLRKPVSAIEIFAAFYMVSFLAKYIYCHLLLQMRINSHISPCFIYKNGYNCTWTSLESSLIGRDVLDSSWIRSPMKLFLVRYCGCAKHRATQLLLMYLTKMHGLWEIPSKSARCRRTRSHWCHTHFAYSLCMDGNELNVIVFGNEQGNDVC
jgi:hypothetical protein